MWFQFHKGTIKTTSSSSNDNKNILFQFHKGTIKTVYFRAYRGNIPSFNSIKVRLKLDADNYPDEYHVFQFHKGTIKTYEKLFTLSSKYLFQFHKGTIKTEQSLHYQRLNNGFNSIKVRLKLTFHIATCLLHRCFNSIKVRLKHRIKFRYYKIGCSFNSIKVRLKPLGSLLSGKAALVFQFHKGTIKTESITWIYPSVENVSIP